jgi:hypothetical protein
MYEQGPTRPPRPDTQVDGWTAGVALFAAVTMVIIGMFQAISAFAAILQNHIYTAVGDYVFKLDIAAWGWVHLLIGILVAVAGVFVYGGSLWARTVGIVMVSVSAVENFMFMPYYPIWSMLIVALDVLVIWALAAHGFGHRAGSPAATDHGHRAVRRPGAGP